MKRASAIVIVFLLTLAALSGCGQRADRPCTHDFYRSGYIAPTEAANGSNIYTCKNCGYTFVHEYSDSY